MLPTIEEKIFEENNSSILIVEPLNRSEEQKTSQSGDSFQLPTYSSTISSAKTIIAADDQVINIEVLRNHLNELNLAEVTEFCVNG